MNETTQNGAEGAAPGVAAAPAATGAPVDVHVTLRGRGDSGLNMKPSGRVAAPAAKEGEARAAESVVNPVFSCQGVSVYYSGKQALKDVSLDVGRRHSRN